MFTRKDLAKLLLPLIVERLLAVLVGMADVVMVAAVGETAVSGVSLVDSISNLMINIFIGLSVGVNVIVARYYGAKREKDVQDTIHTAMALSIVSGLFLIVMGQLLSRPMLELMGTPDDVIDKSTIYMRIIFIGMPANMIYNFGSAILRAVGDTKRPLYFLIVACLSNVVLDLVFVLVFKMGIAGVAIASILAQAISAVMVVMSLSAESMEYRFRFRQMRFEGDILSRTIRIGLPAGFQSIMYSLSNMLIQASVNRFGTDTVASWVVLGKVDGINWMILGALGIASMTFVGQNYGAGRLDRIQKSLKLSLLIGVSISIVFGGALLLFGWPLFGLFTSDDTVLAMSMQLLWYFAPFYWLFVPIEIISGALRGMGDTLIPTIITATGICVFRVAWIYTVVPLHNSMFTVSLSYPISWVLTAIAFAIYYMIARKKLIANAPKPRTAE